MQLPMLIALAAAILLGALAPGPRRRRGDRGAGRRGADAAQLHARLRARGRPHRLPDAAAAPASMCARMAAFFEKMQRNTRVMRRRRVPGYLRTPPGDHRAHRRRAEPRRQRRRTGSTPTASNSSWCAPSCAPRRAMRAMRSTYFRDAVRDRRYRHEPAARYGLALRAAAREGTPRRPKPRSRACARAGGAQPDGRDARGARALAPATTPARSHLKAARARYPHSPPAALRLRSTRCSEHGPQRGGAGAARRAAAPVSARPAAARAAARSLRGARQARCCSTRRRPRSTCCRAACRRRSSSCSSRSPRATATSTSSRWSTRACKELRAQHARELKDDAVRPFPVERVASAGGSK